MGPKPGYRKRRNERMKAWGAKVAASDKAKRIHSVEESTVTLTLENRETAEHKTVVSAGRSGTHECILAALIPVRRLAALIPVRRLGVVRPQSFDTGHDPARPERPAPRDGAS